MTKAIWNGTVVAESDDVVVIDGYTYFPADAVNRDALVESDHTSVCSWKGTANYFTVLVDGAENSNAAWEYRTPSTAAQAVDGRIAFWRGVEIVS